MHMTRASELTAFCGSMIMHMMMCAFDGIPLYFVDDVGQFFGEGALPLRYRNSLSLSESREGSYSVHITIESLLMVKHVLVM